MFTPPQLLDLLARLASNSTTISSSSAIDDQTVNDKVSKLNTFLNNEGEENDSRVRVLNAALSILCFKAPQVYDSRAEFSVNTIIELLSSSVLCRVVTTKKEEVLVVGSCISSFDYIQVLEACHGVIAALDERGMGSETLKMVYGVARLVVSAPCCMPMLPSQVVASDIRPVCGKNKALQHYFLKYLHQDSNDLPLRLLWWHLDPLLLKKDVLKILEEALRRPFLCLNKALRERVDWRSIITCLALSPIMFVEIRRLLHHWFLETGLDIVQELLSELISGILDIISTPICWGLTAEIGLKLPFSISYFSCNPSLLRVFMGPVSSKGIENIVCRIHKQSAHDIQLLDPLLEQVGLHSARIDERYSWALAMNFPEWFYYSCVLLFSGYIFEGNYLADCAPRAPERYQSAVDKATNMFAAKYISWILNPINQSHQLGLCDFFSSVSKTLASNQVVMNRIHKDAPDCQNKLKKAKCIDEKDIDCSSIISCLNRFQSFLLKLPGGTLDCPKPDQGRLLNDIPKNLLYYRVPLGILIGNHNRITDKDCELLMHYAITGKVLQQKDNMNAAYHIGCEEAIAGIHLAFRVTELAEKIWNSVYGTEPSAAEYSCQIKIKLGNYMLKCIKILVEHNLDNVSSTQIKDIRCRLIHWRQQGPDLPVNDEELHNILREVNFCLKS